MQLWPILDSYVKVYKVSEELYRSLSSVVLHAVDTGHFYHQEQVQVC